jgi:hypothetical protein
MLLTPINLRQHFGRRFKVVYAEDYGVQYGPRATTQDPWYMEIPCQNGTIGPWDEGHLVACTRTAGPVVQRLKALPFVQVHQDGTDGVNVVFPVDRFEEVAEILKPRRRRVLSPEARQAAAERLASYRFSPAVGVPKTGLGCVPVGLVDT